MKRFSLKCPQCGNDWIDYVKRGCKACGVEWSKGQIMQFALARLAAEVDKIAQFLGEMDGFEYKPIFGVTGTEESD